jgi:hypothetical protein
VLAILLPELGYPAVSQSIASVIDDSWDTNPDQPATVRPWYAAEAAQAPERRRRYDALRGLKMPLFLCPSDRMGEHVPGTTGGPFIGGEFVYTRAGSAMPSTNLAFESFVTVPYAANPLGRTHYVGVAALGGGTHAVYGQYAGVLRNRSKVRVDDVIDGCSNTLLFGEVAGRQFDVPSTKADYEWSWIGGGTCSTWHGLSDRGSAAIAYQFASNHRGVVPFAFADGSVRDVAVGRAGTIHSGDWWLLQALAGYRDGVDTSGLDR